MVKLFSSESALKMLKMRRELHRCIFQAILSKNHVGQKIGFLKMANLKMAIFLKRPSHYTAPITCTITCNITCNVGRRAQRGQTGPELSKIIQNEQFRTRKSRRVLGTGPFGGANSFKESFW